MNKRVFAQKQDEKYLEAFKNQTLTFKILDSSALKSKKFKIHPKFSNIATFEAINQVNVAYCLNDKNKWQEIQNDKIEFVIGHQFERFDTSGLPEFIIFWQEFNYNKSGGTSTDWMSVIRLDSIPTQIFKICIGCNEEYFGNKDKNGEGSFYNSYIRPVKLSKKGILLSTINKKLFPYPDCPVTALPKGTYKMLYDQIIKVK
ncbi:MAG: hypothetical protein WCR21_03495 [Bacteroidota bacterium]